MEQINSLHEIKVDYNKNYSGIRILNYDQADKICREVYKISNANINLREYLYVIYLNNANQMIGFFQISSGGISETTADIRLILSVALKCLSTSIILCHNHPSGATKPSEKDIMLTKRVQKACDLMNIKCLDHIILTDNEYYSFSYNGLL